MKIIHISMLFNQLLAFNSQIQLVPEHGFQYSNPISQQQDPRKPKLSAWSLLQTRQLLNWIRYQKNSLESLECLQLERKILDHTASEGFHTGLNLYLKVWILSSEHEITERLLLASHLDSVYAMRTLVNFFSCYTVSYISGIKISCIVHFHFR